MPEHAAQPGPQAHVPTLREAQERLLVWGEKLPKWGPDGRGGIETRDAILSFQTKHGLPRSGKFDQKTVDALWREPPSRTHTLAESLALGALSAIVNQALKGTGIEMDFAKISKAIAGGITGAIATTGTMAIVYLQLPPDAQTHFPSFVYSVLPWANEVIGFAVGFCGVYFAPPNKG